MRQVKAIVKKDLRDTLRVKAIYITIWLPLFLFVLSGSTMGETMEHLMKKGLPIEQVIHIAQLMVSSSVLMFALILMLYFAMDIGGYTIVMEKTKRSLESLLCTPLGTRKIWLGKTLVMFLPSVVLGLTSTFLWVVGINQFLIEPKLEAFIMPSTGPLLLILLAVPVITFFTSLLITGLQLIIKRIEWVNIISIGLIVGVGTGASQSMGFDLNSWWIILVFFGIAAILALLAAILFRFVTPERIVLSSKG